MSPDTDTFYAELRPISDDFVPGALAVSGLDREVLLREGRDPAETMRDAARWIVKACEGSSPVLAAYPLSFDWMWVYWYFMNFTGSSPFGHSRCLDLKTLYAAKARVPIGWATKRQMPRHLTAKRPHTHNALDDAMEQAELLQNLMIWRGAVSGEGGPD